MKIFPKRTVASELTLWLSVITTSIALVIGLSYYLYASRTVTRELLVNARITADEFSRILVLPLYNFDRKGAREMAMVYLASGRVSGVRIEGEGLGEVCNILPRGSSVLPALTRKIVKDDLKLGSLTLYFDDQPVQDAKKRAIGTTLGTVAVILLIYLTALHFILRRILVKPLDKLGARLQEIADGHLDGAMLSVPQKDLDTILDAANRMSAEIASRTRILEENERNYREVYNATCDGIFLQDPVDGSILDVNQTVLEMYGYTREEILNRTIEDLSQGDPPYGRKEALHYIQLTMQGVPQVIKWLARRKDGSLFWCEVALKTASIGDQQILLATVRDISKRQHLEEKLQQSQKMETIGTLAGGIAHDFNNILTAILGNTELALLKSKANHELSRHLEHIETASLRARELIRQILTFSSKQRQERKVMPMGSVVHEALDLLRSTLPATVQIIEDLSSRAMVNIDPGQIHQVVINLCTNGFHSMKDASGILTVSLQDIEVLPQGNDTVPDLGPGRYVQLEVRDNGVGMDVETSRKVFDPYFTTKEPGKGTGLGLSVVHGIIRSHQGRITMHSQPGNGTSFRIFLPVSDSEPYAEEQSADPTALHEGVRIMIVDDEASIRSLLLEMLSTAGYGVDLFAAGPAAWKAFAADPERWDLLITDLTMPGMGGVELAQQVAALRPDVPIILCTGYNEPEQEGHRDLISAVLQKPVTFQELLAAIGEVLSQDDADMAQA